MKIIINNTKLLFLYRICLFRFVHFNTSNSEMDSIVKALNIKNRKKRITYIFDEAINVLNTYYSEDLCQFKNGKCIVQREQNLDRVNGCCRLCPNTDHRQSP